MNYRYRFIILAASVIFMGGCEKKTQDVSKTKFVQKSGTQNQEISMEAKAKVVKIETSMGDIFVELNEKAAPVTVKNFLGYVQEGFYNGTIFHRVIPNFMIQGGGHTADLQRKPTHRPIINEACPESKNNRGTIAMARIDNPDSATSQFFINRVDNASLNFGGPYHPGYAVFGKVTDGMDVVDKIAAVKTTTQSRMQNVPVQPVVIISVELMPEE